MLLAPNRSDSLSPLIDVDIKRRKQLGVLAPGIIQSRQTLAAFVEEEWWPRYAIPNLAPDTRRRYLEVWSVHLLPRLGDYELRQITPMVVEDFREQMTRAKVGAPTQRKTLMLRTPQMADDRK